MQRAFRAYRIHQIDGQIRGRVEQIDWDQLGSGEVVVEGHFSSVNFKDALAGSGQGKILRRYPLVGGIDVAGLVVASRSADFKVGDPVVVTGCGLSESQNGGYSEFTAAPAESVVPLPPGLSLEESMLLGTAGFTAALSLFRLEQNGQTPQKGPILITGASGGVGSIATDILAAQGYEVWAVSGKADAAEMLTLLGARKIFAPTALDFGDRALENVRFAGAIDNVGGELLAGILRHVDLWGNVASVGLTGGAEFHTTVMPFILRGVSLLGISSNNCPRALRLELWRRLAGLWKPRHLTQIHARTVGLGGLAEAFSLLLERRLSGRILVDLRSPK